MDPQSHLPTGFSAAQYFSEDLEKCNSKQQNEFCLPPVTPLYTVSVGDVFVSVATYGFLFRPGFSKDVILSLLIAF